MVIAASLPVLGLLAVAGLIIYVIVKVCINISRKRKAKRYAMAQGHMTSQNGVQQQ